MHGTIITEKFDIPETFIAIISSVFLIFRKNQIPDNKITNGKKLFSKLGINNELTMVCKFIAMQIDKNNLIPENTNYEIWITEYDTEPSDKKWVGTWPHALSFLYRTLRYIEDVPNVTLLSPNNLYGFWGPYQLLDSYSIDNAGNDGISCYVSHDFSRRPTRFD